VEGKGLRMAKEKGIPFPNKGGHEGGGWFHIRKEQVASSVICPVKWGFEKGRGLESSG